MARDRWQADITRRMFEAGHRPYVAIQVEGNDIPKGPDAASLNVIIENVGTVPAAVTGWNVTCILRNAQGTQSALQQIDGQKVLETILGGTFFPGQQYSLRHRVRGRGHRRDASAALAPGGRQDGVPWHVAEPLPDGCRRRAHALRVSPAHACDVTGDSAIVLPWILPRCQEKSGDAGTSTQSNATAGRGE